MLTYNQFINEYHDQFDEDNVGFRNHMLDVFMPYAKDDKSKEEKINSIVSTFCVAANKQLRFDEDLIKDLAILTGLELKEVMKKLQKESDEYYNGFRGNLIGMS
jgi:hypothetical protein